MAAPGPLVDSWGIPTRVILGGTRAGSGFGAGPVLLVRDARVPLPPWLAPPVALELAREPGIADLAFLEQVIAARRTVPGGRTVAVGGGSVLDPARLAALADRSADLLAGLLGAAGAGGGVLPVPAEPSAHCGVVCVPTTLGTAAEVSPVAVMRVGSATVLVISPALRAEVAVLDPTATAGLSPRQLALGLIEPLVRTIFAAVSGPALAVQDGQARALAGTLMELARELAAGRADHEWRAAASLASVATHTGFLALQRPPFAMRLWPVATELASPAWPKAAVMARLLPAWLAGIAGGELGSRWGTPARVQAILGRPVDEAARWAAEWTQQTGVAEMGPDARVAGDPDPATQAAAVADRVCARWSVFLGSHPPAEGDQSWAEVRWLAEQASIRSSPGTWGA